MIFPIDAQCSGMLLNTFLKRAVIRVIVLTFFLQSILDVFADLTVILCLECESQIYFNCSRVMVWFTNALTSGWFPGFGFAETSFRSVFSSFCTCPNTKVRRNSKILYTVKVLLPHCYYLFWGRFFFDFFLEIKYISRDDMGCSRCIVENNTTVLSRKQLRVV